MRSILPFLILGLLLTVGFEADAQCAMCSKAAMDGIKDGNTASAGLNAGILYLVSLPYLLGLTIAALWFYKRRMARLEAQHESE